MNFHKLFKELFEISIDDSYMIEDYFSMVRDARTEFKNVGVPLTYEAFKQWFQRAYGPFSQPQQNNKLSGARDFSGLWKIIEGDNLDIIEDAAKDKGLI